MADGVKIADEFSRIYKKEWKAACKDLSKDRHEEEIIYLLMRIVRGIFDMCIEDFPHMNHPSPDKALKEYLHRKLPKSIQKEDVTESLHSFIRVCMKTACVMTAGAHPLDICWTPKGDIIDFDKFELEPGKTGQICDWTIWPAVVDKKGNVIRKGIVLPVI